MPRLKKVCLPESGPGEDQASWQASGMASLEAQYVAAHQEWQKSGEAEVWEAVVNDGLDGFQSVEE